MINCTSLVFTRAYNIINQSLSVEFRMSNDRLNVTLLVRKSLLGRLSVPLASADFEVPRCEIEDAMSAGKDD